ncbi:UNVERIFIED_ORG: hypothetical protein JN05_00420 [Zoogloea ramigera]|uniref:BAG domain-containing protein n=1 Tax=Duganella zoogloeoides TaxID=75659 RepID=A0ABZ0XS98_9BURK|nr:hypothetical protein [Duganella zoogloeoides]WQH02620.1 hypothetical protein SR858_16215 [Duganella zoogloeoides]
MLSSPLYSPTRAARAEPPTPGGDTASRLQAQSLEAMAKLKQKQADQARERAAVIRALRTSSAQAAKAAARERIEMIKKRIEELVHLLALFGSSGARGALQELKQLANQLKEAAAVLRSGDGAAAESGGEIAAPSAPATPSVPPAPAPAPAAPADADHAEGRAAYADQQQAADAEANDPFKHHDHRRTAQDSQRDADLVDKVRKALRFAQSMAEADVKKEKAAASG